MRFGLGCMRLSTELERDEALALATLRAALDAGVAVFDTAHAYGRDETDYGHNERLVGGVLARSAAASASVRVVTKCGMRREGAAWIADGRATRIADDVAASVEALGGTKLDTLLLHAPDPRTSLATTARALVRAAEKAGAARIGVSNVSRKQLEEIMQHAPIAAVEVALGAYDDLAVRNGVVGYCLARGIEVLAHAPLGGPKRVGRLARDSTLASVAAAHAAAGVSTVEVFLAYLLALPAGVVPIVGARRPERIASFTKASELELSEEELLALDARFPVLGGLRRPPHVAERGALAPSGREREVVMMMGVPGAGKSRAAEEMVARGYERLNRDMLGGTLRGIVRRLDERLRGGADRIVLDNTYVTRQARNDVVRVAAANGAMVRCIYFDTPPHEAQVNIVHRMIDRFGTVLAPADLARRAREDPAALGPMALHRMTRDLEPPTADEGFASIETVTFAREHPASARRGGVAVNLDAAEEELARIVAEAAEGAACLLFAWRPAIDEAAVARAHATAEALSRATGRIVEVAICGHAGGPPICWCRPPLPGMWLAFARRHAVDVRESVLHGNSAADRTMARALCMRFVELAR